MEFCPSSCAINILETEFNYTHRSYKNFIWRLLNQNNIPIILCGDTTYPIFLLLEDLHRQYGIDKTKFMSKFKEWKKTSCK